MDIFEMKNIAPMLIAEERPAFDSADWIYELKLDGIRCVAYLDPSGTVLRNKRNKDVTAIYPELGQIHRQVKKRCILDGEVFVLKDGRTDFFEVQRRALMSNAFRIGLAAEKLSASFVAFDLLYLGGEQIVDRPLLERKSLLQKTAADSARMAVSRYIEKNGTALYEAAEKQELEGVVAKRKDSRYYFGKRTRDWIKCKALLDEDFVVCGYYHRDGSVASVILGSFDEGRLVYRGHVVMGVSRADYTRMTAAAAVDKQKYCGAFPNFEGAAWLEPELVCTVKFVEYTPGGGLRQPVFKGLRVDKEPRECVVGKR